MHEVETAQNLKGDFSNLLLRNVAIARLDPLIEILLHVLEDEVEVIVFADYFLQFDCF